MPEPGISVDRAVNHYLESIDISPAAAAEFYEDLPIPDKPPLEDCHIHFSGLAQNIGQHRTGYGLRVHDPVDAKRHDPQAPESDILIFVGSFVRSDKLADMDSTLKHELTHYAQGETTQKDQITDREAAIVVQLGFMRGRLSKILFAGKAALNSVLVDVLGNYTGARVSIAEAIGAGTSIAAATSLINRRKKRQTIYNFLEKELHEISLNLPRERQASGFADSDHPLVRFTPRVNPQPVLYRNQSKRSATNIVVDKAHQTMSLIPPAKWPSKTR